MLTYFNLSLKEIFRRRRRSIYTFSGIALAALLVSFSYLVTSSLNNSFNRVLNEVGADIIVQAHGEPCVWAPVKLPTNLNPIAIEMLEKAKKIGGVKKASGILICWAFNGESGNLHPSVIAGVEPQERELGPSKLSQSEGSGNWMVKGRYLEDLDVYTTVLDYDFAKFLKADLGSRIYFGQDQFEVVGIMQAGRDARIAGAQAFIPLRTAQQMLKRGEVVDTIFVQLESSANPKRIVADLKKLFGENSSITTSLDFPAMVVGLSAFTNLFTLGMLIFIFIVSIGFSMRSISASVSERIKELCVMKAIGWTSKNLQNLIFIESLIIGFFGAIIGTSLGFLFSRFYLNSIKLRISDVLAAYPPCATTPVKLEVALSGTQFDIFVLIIVIASLTFFTAFSSIFVTWGLRKIECAKGIRSL
ncbi:MAG: ABC transporter permease [Candidatus Omnitrophica bacterium]|nr:ABC transporter permease [Candidatus Omnitrophota bacterium]